VKAFFFYFKISRSFELSLIDILDFYFFARVGNPLSACLLNGPDQILEYDDEKIK
jgi:hypothetical protein